MYDPNTTCVPLIPIESEAAKGFAYVAVSLISKRGKHLDSLSLWLQ